ncbi:hypothetical protein OAG29_03025 [Planctomycetaceae bacterium]|nr:hypothetical protein [Planctomycetaceae bacterium]
MSKRVCLLMLAVVMGAFVSNAQQAFAQKYDFNQGFDVIAPAIASGAELNDQTNLFVMELQFRPMGLVTVPITDPKTGKVSRQLVWYQVYRTRNVTLDSPVDDTDTAPVNPKDPIPRPYLIPEFFLIADAKDTVEVYADQVIPEAVSAIEQREKLKLKNSVEIIQRIPDAVAEGDDPKWIYGVATWIGIDPNTDYFKLFAEGFSNGYQIAKIEDESIVLRKTVELKYWRPGDDFQQGDEEIRRNPEDPKPGWLYRPSGIAPQPAK